MGINKVPVSGKTDHSLIGAAFHDDSDTEQGNALHRRSW
jgi:hypothetical protein